MAANSSDTRNTTLIPSATAKTTFLVIFLVIGLFGNLFLIITIGSNRKHRSTVIHILTINLAVTNLLECLLNFSFAIGYTVSPSDELDPYLCRTNAFFMNLVMTETPLMLTVYSIDRFIYSVFPERYTSFQNIPRTLFMILYTWIHAFAFCFPYVAGLLSIEIYHELSVCLPSENINTIYLTLFTLFCVILPFFAIIIFFIFIIKAAFSQRDHIHTIMTKHQYSKDSDSDRIQYMNEVSASRFVGILCLTWLLCEMPFIGTYIVRLTFSNITYSSYVNVTLLWLKFSYVMALPLLAFTLNKDIWHTFKDMVLCKKRNSVNDAANKEYSPDSTKDSLSDKLKEKIKFNDDKKSGREESISKDQAVRNTGFQVPVLFATSHGVHIHTLNSDESLSENDDYYDNPNVVKCDVAGSQEFLNQYDTSDYDSGNELDPFSVSHPVTSKTLKDSDETMQRRSSSHPEVRMKSANTTTISVTVTSAADSGLDISTTKTTISKPSCDTSNSNLISTQEYYEKKADVNQSNEYGGKSEIPVQINSQMESFANLHLDKMPASLNSNISDLDSTISSISDGVKVRKKKRRKEKPSKDKTLPINSNNVVDIRPPTRLQPLTNSLKYPDIHNNSLNKLSIDVLSAQQLCDTSESVVTPSSCHLISNNELIN